MPELRVAVRVRKVDVDFTVPVGVTALFGPSGAGKSTILGAIAGLVSPEQGRITLGDDVWFDAATRTMCPVHERKVAYVFQSLALFPHMSAVENVEYGVSRATPKRDRYERARAMLAKMKVGHVAEQRPRTLSGGEAQRVALARAFAMEPKVVLLDEAFSAMDRELRRELALEVRRYVDDVGIPAVVVTHHRNEARAMSDRVVLLDDGRITATGRADELLPLEGPNPAFAAPLT